MRRINFLRGVRLLVLLTLALEAVAAVVTVAGGSGIRFMMVTALVTLTVSACFQTFAIRSLERREGAKGSLWVALLRKITGRHRPDYGRLRELETECGLTQAPARQARMDEANAAWRALGSPDARLPGARPGGIIRVESKVISRKRGTG